MENKKKSYFNELGFKATIDKLVNHVAKLYLEDQNPWVVGYSGGKDSSACLQLMWRVLEKLKSENKTIKPLYVITTDTLVENPVVATWVKSSIDLLREKAKENHYQYFHHYYSKYRRDFLGKFNWQRLSSTQYKFRWCTERMKIRPSDRYLRKLASDSGEAVLVIGTRKAESSNRSISITKLEKEATEKISKNI